MILMSFIDTRSTLLIRGFTIRDRHVCGRVSLLANLNHEVYIKILCNLIFLGTYFIYCTHLIILYSWIPCRGYVNFANKKDRL